MSPSAKPAPTSSDSLPAPRSEFRWTHSPNPDWKLGGGLGEETPAARAWREDEEKGWTDFYADKVDKPSMYRLLTGGITPRPIAFVCSMSSEGALNLAPFSFFGVISHSPPLIMFSVSSPGGGDKDTIANLRVHPEFTLNIISAPWIEAANFASVDAPPGVSEWKGTGLRAEKSTLIKPPWIRESAFAMECTVYQLLDIQDPDLPSRRCDTVVLGRIKLFHARNAVLAPSPPGAHGSGPSIDPAAFRPVARLEGNQYATLGEGFVIPKVVWKDVEAEVLELEAEAEGAVNGANGGVNGVNGKGH